MSTASTVDGDDHVEGWMSWQRTPENASCWTRVYAVLRCEFLLFYRSRTMTKYSFKEPLLEIAVARVERTTTTALFQLQDVNGECMTVSLYCAMDGDLWFQRLSEAAETTQAFLRTNQVAACDLPRSSLYAGNLIDLNAYASKTKKKWPKPTLAALLQTARSINGAARRLATHVPASKGLERLCNRLKRFRRRRSESHDQQQQPASP